MRTLLLVFVAAPLAFVVLTADARPAHAGIAVGLDLNGSKLIGDGAGDFATGAGANVRLGYQLPIPIIDLQPGLLLRYNRWKYEAMGADGTLTDVDGMVGGRVALGLLLKPFAQAFFGYGSLKTDIAGEVVTEKGPSVLVGAGLDFSVAFIAVGVHADYNKVVVKADEAAGTERSATQWVSVGVDATLAF